MKAIEKSFTLATDVVIIDLEDAVAVSSKGIAREQVVKFIKEFGSKSPSSSGASSRPAIVVRANCPLRTADGLADLKALTSDPSLGLDAICLPKVDNSEDIKRLVANFPGMGAGGYGGVGGSSKIPIWAMIETAKGVQNVDEIARCSHIEALILGSNDLSKELGARHVPSRLPLIYSISKLVLAARAEGKYAIDGVFMNIKDGEGMLESCKQGRDFGFHGKSLIHPSQVEHANSSFSPSTEEIAYSKEVIAAFEEARRNGKAVAVVRDRLVEELHAKEAQLILDIDRQIRQKSS
jgi:citrate lyase beta subunit